MELPSFYRTFAKNILRHSDVNPLHVNASCKLSISCSMLSIVLMLASSICAQATGLYSPQQLTKEVASFLAKDYGQTPHERIDINVGSLDNRLRLGQCPNGVEFTTQDPTGLGGNISVKAQCNSHIKWTVHVPAQVMIHREIPVAAQDIVRGQSITANHLTSAVVNISSIRQGFAANVNAVIGKEAKRNIGKGEPFRTAQLDAPTTVRRGDIVVLESVAGPIKVSSSGVAMGDGRLGQKIRVKNDSSERIITGIVKGQGLVQIL